MDGSIGNRGGGADGFRLPIEGTEIVWSDALPILPESARVFDGIRRDGRRVELDIEGIARYHVVEGRRIEVQVDAASDRETAWFFLKATPFGLLVQQRGELPLHAAALVPPGGGKALLVAGDSGAGKSTTSAQLVQKGWTLLNDDISRLVFDGGRAMVWPGFQSLKLSARSLEILGLDKRDAPRTKGFKEKYYWHVDGAKESSEAGALVVLADPEAVPTDPVRLTGMSVFEELYRQTFRPYLVVPLGFQAEHFRLVAKLASLVPCFRIQGMANRRTESTEAMLRGLVADVGAVVR